MTSPQHIGTGITPSQQNTHWYHSEYSLGWTANPEHALPGEVERVGLHDCAAQNCQESHSCSAEWYFLRQIASEQTASRRGATLVRSH